MWVRACISHAWRRGNSPPPDCTHHVLPSGSATALRMVFVWCGAEVVCRGVLVLRTQLKLENKCATAKHCAASNFQSTALVLTTNLLVFMALSVNLMLVLLHQAMFKAIYTPTVECLENYISPFFALDFQLPRSSINVKVITLIFLATIIVAFKCAASVLI